MHWSKKQIFVVLYHFPKKFPKPLLIPRFTFPLNCSRLWDKWSLDMTVNSCFVSACCRWIFLYHTQMPYEKHLMNDYHIHIYLKVGMEMIGMYTIYIIYKCIYQNLILSLHARTHTRETLIVSANFVNENCAYSLLKKQKKNKKTPIFCHQPWSNKCA